MALEFKRLPKSRLDDSLSDLSPQAKTSLRNEMLDMGYPLSEINAKFGNDIGSFTMKDVLKFMARRRLKPRYDEPTDSIVLDGAVQPVTPIEELDTV